MKKLVILNLFFLFVVLIMISCQKIDNQLNNNINSPKLDNEALVGTTWSIQNTQINSQTVAVFGFQSQVEIKFLAGGKGTVSYPNKELGEDSIFEWEIKNASNALVIKENRKITVLEIVDFQKDSFTYSFIQGGKNYLFNLKRM